MTPASELRSGKTDRDENFPVASWIIHPRHRALILAFYNFVRTADDIADHALLDAPAKLALLDELEADLLGQGDGQAEAVVPARGAPDARDAPASCARRPDSLPDGRDQAALRRLG
jgi:phytoene/squalene synthetase